MFFFEHTVLFSHFFEDEMGILEYHCEEHEGNVYWKPVPRLIGLKQVISILPNSREELVWILGKKYLKKQKQKQTYSECFQWVEQVIGKKEKL